MPPKAGKGKRFAVKRNRPEKRKAEESDNIILKQIIQCTECPKKMFNATNMDIFSKRFYLQ